MLVASTLGKLQLVDGDVRVQPQRGREVALLVYLACQWPRTPTRERLARTFWPDSPEKHAAHSLRQALFRLSSQFPSLRFESRSATVAVPPDILRLDLAEFRRLARAGDWLSAGELYGGPFLEDFSSPPVPEVEEWLEEERAAVARVAEEVFRHLLRRAEDRGEWAEVERPATELLRLNPLDQEAETALVGLMGIRGALGEARRHHAAFLERLNEAGESPIQELIDVGARLREEPYAREPEEGPALPLIGRAREFGRLKERLVAAQNGAGSTVVLLGRAGVGKTRLGEQLLRLAAIRGIRVLAGAANPLLSNVPYAVLRQLLAGLESRDLERVAPGVVATLSHLLPGASGRSDAAPAATQPREWLYEAAAVLLGNIAESTPLVVFVDDIHWLDAATGQLLAHVSAALRSRRALLVLAARPEELPLTCEWTRGGPNGASEVIELAELCEAEIDELIRAFSARQKRPVPAAAATLVKRRAAGNAFFAIELLRDTLRGEEATPPGQLPESLQKFLSARLHALSPGALAVTDALAVLGGAARDDVLGSVVGALPQVLADSVDELRAAGVVRDEGEEVAFYHDLVREAAYSRLGGTRRRMLHARAVRALRGIPGVDLGALAQHSASAGDHAAACRFATAAAEQARRRFGHAEAEPFRRMAVEHAVTDRTRTRCKYELAHCLSRNENRLEAHSLFLELIAEPDLSRDMRIVVRSEALAAGIGFHDREDALAEFSCLLSESKDLSSERDRSMATEALLYFLAISGARQVPEGEVLQLMDAALRAPASTRKARSLGHLGSILLMRRDDGRLREALVEVTQLGAELGGYWAARGHALRGVVDLFQGRLRGADRAFREGAETVAAAGHRAHGVVLSNWGVVKMELGEFTAAQELLSQALQWARQSGTPYIWANSESNLAWLEFERGDFEQSVVHALASCEAAGPAPPQSSATLSVGVLALVHIDRPEAEEYRTRVLAVLDEEPAFGRDTSYAEIFLARMSEREGKVDEALERLERAIEWYDRRDFFCHGRLVLEKARLIGTRDRDAGLALAREVRGRAAEAEGVLLMNKAEALIRELKRAPSGGGRRAQTPSQTTRVRARTR